MAFYLFICFLLLCISSLCKGLPTSPYGPIEVHLLSGPTSRASLAEFEVQNARQALHLIKKKLGPDVLHDLVQSDIDEADKFWHDIIKHSKRGHKISDVRVEALVSTHILNTTILFEYLTTFANNGFPNRLIDGNPQHYLIQDSPDNVQEVIENWGTGPITHFKVVPSERTPYMDPLCDFPLQFTREMVLRDGTSLAHEILAVRDNPDGSGMEVVLINYFPSATPEYQIEGVREHVAVELGNWMKFAYEDIVSGRFVPSTQAPGSGKLVVQRPEL